jgi:hypothetical protein
MDLFYRKKIKTLTDNAVFLTNAITDLTRELLQIKYYHAYTAMIQKTPIALDNGLPVIIETMSLQIAKLSNGQKFKTAELETIVKNKRTIETNKGEEK